MLFCNLLGWIWQSLCLDHVNSNGYAKCYQNIPKGSRNMASFTFFRIWTSAKPRPIPNIIWQSHWLNLINIPMCMQNFITIFFTALEIGPFSHFQNLELGKASTDKKCQFEISWLDLVNVNVYAKVHQNIPLSSRDRAIFTFSEFGTGQSLDRW